MSNPELVKEFLRANAGCNSGESDTLQYLKLFIQLAYLLPFGLLYLSFLVTIVKEKKDRELFEDSFFKLQLADGIITIYFLISDTSFFRLTSFIRPFCEYLISLLKDSSFTLTPFYTLYLYSQLAKMLSTAAMCLNRFTSVSNPVKHKTFWFAHCRKIIIAMFIIPMFFVWPVAIGTTSFVPFQGNAIISYEHVVPWARSTYGRLIIAVPTLILNIYSSIITSTKLRKLGAHMKRVEFSMNVATVFTSIGFVLVLVLQVIYLATSTDNLMERLWIMKIITAGTQLANDFYMLSGPVVLLILDKRMRSALCCLKRKIDSKKITKVSVQAVTVSNNSTR